MQRLTTVLSGTGKYEICHNEHGFWAIEHVYIGRDGCLKAPINGLQGCLSDTFEEACQRAVHSGLVKEFTERYNPTREQLFAFIAAL